MPAFPKPAMLVVTSTVVRGAIGGRSAVFALERLGFPVWSLSTVTLPWHPGHGRSARIVPSDDAFAALVDDLCRAPWIGEIGGILTGYVGSPAQPAIIARLVDAVKARRPDALYLCDPILGDNGTLYIPEPTAAAIRDDLVPRADILTPNATELGFLVGGMPAERGEAIDAARSLGPARVAITSAQRGGGETETWFIAPGGVLTARHALMDGQVPHGTGDLFSGLLLGRLAEGASDREALRLATAGVVDALQAAERAGADELPLAAMQDRLLAPRAAVEIGELA